MPYLQSRFYLAWQFSFQSVGFLLSLHSLYNFLYSCTFKPHNILYKYIYIEICSSMLSTYKKPNYNVRTKVLYQMVPSDSQSQLFLFFILYLQISQHPSLMLHMTYRCPAQHLHIFLFIPQMNSVRLHFIPTSTVQSPLYCVIFPLSTHFSGHSTTLPKALQMSFCLLPSSLNFYFLQIKSQANN